MQSLLEMGRCRAWMLRARQFCLTVGLLPEPPVSSRKRIPSQIIPGWRQLLVGLSLIGGLATLAHAADIQYVYDELGRLVEAVAPDGTSAQYSYDAVGNIVAIQKNVAGTPSIAEFTPNSGPVGTVVTVYGSGFDTTAANNTVTFNGVQASVTAATAIRLTVTVPSGATTGKIGVTTATGSTTSATDYQVSAALDAPTITSFTPTIGAAGSTVTITGTNYDTVASNDRAELNSRYAAIGSSTATSIAATVPDTTSSGKIQIATPYGSVTSSADFFVPPPPYTAADIEVTDRMAIGDTKTVTIGTTGKKALILFDGNQGQTVSLSLSSGTLGSGTISIIAPDGRTVSSMYLSSSPQLLDAQTLPLTGTYTIFINPTSSSGSATIQLNNVQDVTGTIAIGGPAVTVTTTTAGQNASLTFSGTAGQRISLKLPAPTLSNGYYVDVTILNPDGTVLVPTFSYYYSSSRYVDVQTLPATGTYTIKLDPENLATGSISAQLYDVPPDVSGSIAAGGPAVTVTTTMPGQNASLTFSGTAGQRVSLKLPAPTLSNGYYVDVTILNPDGTVLVPTFYYYYSSSRYVDVQTLPATGTYTIKLDPEDMATGSISAQLYDVPADVSDSIAAGGPAVTVTTTTPGQNASLTFSGTAGQRVSLNLPAPTLSNGYYVDVTILNPDGTVLVPRFYYYYASSRYVDVQTLPATGTYTIKLDPEDMATGSISAQLYDVPADVSGSIAAGGPAVTVTTTTPGQNASLTFSGTAGQRVSLNLPAPTLSNGYYVDVTILNPDGTVLVPRFYYYYASSRYVDVQTLPATGTYTIKLDPEDMATGSISAQLYDVPADLSGSIGIGGAAVTVTTTIPGQNASLSFSGAAGQQVTVHFTSSTLGCDTISLNKPDGSRLASAEPCGTSYDFTQTLTVTGTHTIGIDPSGASTGSASFSLSSP